MNRPVRLELLVDGWRPHVDAEILEPPQYGLAVHLSPWSKFWWVSDVLTGQRLAVGHTREDAIAEAVCRLTAAMDDCDRDVPDVLRRLRHPCTH